jgi:hypothetical protein
LNTEVQTIGQEFLRRDVGHKGVKKPFSIPSLVFLFFCFFQGELYISVGFPDFFTQILSLMKRYTILSSMKKYFSRPLPFTKISQESGILDG